MKIGQSAGKSYAYLLGVFLGDGCVTHPGGTYRKDALTFKLNTIDPEFAEATKAALLEFTDRHIGICTHAVSKSSKPNHSLHCQDQQICEHLVEVTQRKQVIPDFVHNWPKYQKIAFIEGLMDSEGFVGERCTEVTNRRFYMGFKSCDVWVPDFVRVLESVGIKVGKISQEVPRKEGYKIPTRFTIKMQSWIDSGAKFRIVRKQRRVDEWASFDAYVQRSRYPRRLSPETNMPNTLEMA